MKVFLIVVAAVVLVFALIFSISAEFTVIFDKGWTSKVRILFVEKDIKLSKLLSFLVAPEEAGRQTAEKSKKKRAKKSKKEKPEPESAQAVKAHKAETENPKISETADEKEAADKDSGDKKKNGENKKEKSSKNKKKKPEKKNFIKNILDEDGIAGLGAFFSNLIQTANTAVSTLIKGLHIYSLYVKMIIGGGGAADIAEKYGAICGWYYPVKGIILNQMKVDEYDDLIIPDFIAPRSEYEFQFIGSISVGLLVRMLLRAGATFLKNYLKNR